MDIYIFIYSYMYIYIYYIYIYICICICRYNRVVASLEFATRVNPIPLNRPLELTRHLQALARLGLYKILLHSKILCTNQ